MSEGRVALVTGSSRGIGQAIAVKLASQGARVAINCFRDLDGAAETLRLIESSGGQAVIIRAELGSAEGDADLLGTTHQALGDIDILAHNAVYFYATLLPRFKREEWDKLIQINLTAAFELASGVYLQMARRRWGRIVFISSVIALAGNTGQSGYGAAKAGLIGLAKSVAVEYGAREITCNVVAPGYIRTRLTEDVHDETIG